MTTEKEDSFASMFEQQPVAPRKRRAIRVGDRLDAVVIQVGRDAVFVELDGKQQAFLEAAELRDDDGTMSVKVGDKLSANVVEINDEQGVVRLGRSLGKPGSVAALEMAKASGLGVDGKITGVNKGGLEVEVGGARAFCPMSQVDARRIEEEDAKAMIGQTLKFMVTEVKDGGKSVVLSRRNLLAREATESATRALSDIVPGA